MHRDRREGVSFASSSRPGARDVLQLATLLASPTFLRRESKIYRVDAVVARLRRYRLQPARAEGRRGYGFFDASRNVYRMDTVVGPPDYRAIARASAHQRGAAVAFATAEPEVATRQRMGAAFAGGGFATWRYDAAYAAAASDPATILSGARSVVCVAVPFAHPEPPGRAPLCGRVSNYAWSADYHARMRDILGEIARALDAAAGSSVTRITCDTAPLAERAFAARAGLGWIGKHTNLIAPGLGSFVFLGEIVTTLEIPPDAPLKKTCGTCTRCIGACPTGALRGDYTIDANRCISDLTQRTDAIPRELRASIGDWVWGCDLCQLVCPPTKRASPRADAAFAPRVTAEAFPALLDLLRVRSGEFKRRYRHTAMGWRGAAVLRRNAAVALGNALDRAAVPALVEALEADAHPLVRGHAAWALGRIGSPRALEALRRRETAEADRAVREEIGAALEAWETFGGAAALELRRNPSR
jgi:epoxyqueuosine reductase